MRIRLILGLALILALPPIVDAATGTVTVATANVSDQAHLYKRYTVSWTSTAGGAVSANAFTIVAGEIVSVRFTPGATTPSDLYDVTLAETSGVVDLLLGQGADRSSTVVSVLQFDPPLFQDGSRTIDVVVANAGNAKTGTVVILVKVR